MKRDATGIYESGIEDDVEEAVENALDKYKEEELEDSPRSDSQRIFNRHINTLKQEWISISREDADIIAILAKKYGAV